MKKSQLFSLALVLAASFSLSAQANTITLNDTNNAGGFSFFGGTDGNTPTNDASHIYVQIVAQNTEIPNGFPATPPPIVSFGGTYSDGTTGNFTFSWFSGGYPAPTPAGNVNAALRLGPTGSGPYSVEQPGVIKLSFTSGPDAGSMGNLLFTSFTQSTPAGNGNKPVVANGTYNPTGGSLGSMLIALTFGNIGGSCGDPQNAVCIKDLFGTDGVISQATFTGTLNPNAVVPLPAALPLFAGGLGLMGWMARRRRNQTAHA